MQTLRARTPEMVDALAALVSVESPSTDHDALARCADTVAELGTSLLDAEPDRIRIDGRTHLRWQNGPTRVLILGHFDTVWPLGTLQRWPFASDGVRATGPGTFDMKAGIVQALFGLSLLDDLSGVSILLTSDEEIGSPTSRALIEAEAKGARAALVAEPSAAGALKIARKGVAMYRVDIEGRAAHAGLEPWNGANALVELAHQVLRIREIERLADGTTVTPTVASAGTARNVVPALASLDVDVRILSDSEGMRVDDAMRRLAPIEEGTRVSIGGGMNRPPLPQESSADLFERARAIGERLGLSALEGVAVGGASDGNFTAGIGTPTLDGLGAVGDGAHAEGEHVLVEAMPARAALLADLVSTIT